MTILLDDPHIPKYEKVDPTISSESDFEILVLRMLSRLYPSCHVVPFKPFVIYNGEKWCPDLALFDKGWAFWIVIEVEIATHSFEKHVLPQVRAFRDGEYSERSAEIISERFGISLDRAKTIIKYVPRYIAVVSNHEDPVWERKLTVENIQYMSIASYEKGSGSQAHVVTGFFKAAERSVGFGIALPSFQAVRFPRTDFWKPQIYRIIEPGGVVANWDCFLEDRTGWLVKRRGLVSLPDKVWVQMLQQDENSLLLRIL